MSGRNDLLTYRTYRGDLLANPEATFDRVNQLLSGTNLAVTGGLHDNTQRIDNSFRDITEDTAALYVSANIDFDELTGIIGARYVTTDLTSGYISDGEFTADENDYSDFLPSINLNYSLNDDTQIRFAAAMPGEMPATSDAPHIGRVSRPGEPPAPLYPKSGRRSQSARTSP